MVTVEELCFKNVIVWMLIYGKLPFYADNIFWVGNDEQWKHLPEKRKKSELIKGY